MERKSRNGGFKLTNAPFKSVGAILVKALPIIAKVAGSAMQGAAKAKQNPNEKKEEEKEKQGFNSDLVNRVVGAWASSKGGRSGGVVK